MRAVFIALFVSLIGVASAQGTSAMDKKELAMIAGLDKKYQAAKKASAASPKDEKLKTAYVAATLSLADVVLVSPALTPKDKYPRALRLYREVRKIEPTNKKAKEKIELIEGIYRSMGRPIPK